MPKVKSNHEGSSSNYMKPYHQGEGSLAKPQRHNRNATDSTKNTNTKTTDRNINDISNPTSIDNVLKYYIKNHSSTIESVNAQCKEAIENLKKANFIIAEKNHENANLKKQVQIMEDQVQELKNQIGSLSEENDMLQYNCAQLNEKYTSLETGYDQTLSNLEVVLNNQKTDLAQQQIRNEDLQKELSTVQQKNQQIVAQLKLVEQEKNSQISEMQMKLAELTAYYSQVEATAEKEKLQLMQTIEGLEAAQGQLKQQNFDLAEQLKSSVFKEAELQLTLKKMEQSEKLCLELEQINTNLSNEAINKVRCLEDEVGKKQQEIDGLSGQYQNLTLALKTAEDRYQAEIKALSEAKEQLSALKTAEERYQAEIVALTETNEQLSALKTAEERYQAEIKALTETNEQMSAEKGEQIAKAQQELNEHEIQKAEIRKKLDELNQQNLDVTKKLSAENSELKEQMQAIQKIHENTLAQLQNNLKQKDAEIAALKQEQIDLNYRRNLTLKELQYRIAQIGNTCGQVVGNGVFINREQEMGTNGKLEIFTAPETLANLQPADPVLHTIESSDESTINIATKIQTMTTALIDPAIQAGARQPRQQNQKRARPTTYSSDFNSDTDNTDWQPQKPKLVKKNKSRKTNRLCEASDLFDTLKKSA